MLEFDVQVEGNVGAVDLVAALVGTGEVLFNLNGQPPVLFPVLELVQLEVLLLQPLSIAQPTSNFSISACNCAVVSDMSLISEKLTSFFR
jgi:hypothetical protein